jgi:GTPase SAR1 family protein
MDFLAFLLLAINTEVTIAITDTGGTEHFGGMTDSVLRDQDGVMIVYDVHAFASASIEHWLARVCILCVLF